MQRRPRQRRARPALTLSTSNSAGSSGAYVGTDATIAAFDATVPVTQALGDSAATGSAGTAARRDHKHGMPVAPVLSDAAVATSQTQSGNNSWADLATVGPAVTVTVPASGKVKITIVANMSTNNTAGYQSMGVAISGATTQAAGTNNAAGVPMEIDYNPKVVGGALYYGATFLQTGLAAGSTTFTAKYNQFGTAGTATYANRYLLVETVP
jgi:hypothetical protein